MARGFGTTFGAGATDSVQTSYATLSSTTRSYFCWFWINASPTNCRIFSNITAGAENDGFFDLTGNPLQYQRGFSTTAGAWTVVPPSNSAWHSLLVTYDASSTANNPVIYIDGSSVTVTRATAPVGTAITTSASYYVGNDVAGNRAWDGKLAHFSMWSSILTANEAKALASGVSPLQICSSNQLIYLPLNGIQTGEADWGPSHFTQTLIGTLYQNDPPVMSLYPLQSTG